MPRTAQYGEKELKTAKRRQQHCKPRPKPYFGDAGGGLNVGYLLREPKTAGKWIARREIDRRISSGKDSGKPMPYAVYQQWTVGIADDLAMANGRDVLTYEQAKRKAAAEADKHQAGEPRRRNATVRDLIEAYIASRATNKGKASGKDSANKLRRFVLLDAKRGKDRMPEVKPIAHKKVAELRLGDLRDWLDSLIPSGELSAEELRKAQNTANRVLSDLRAALNYGYTRGDYGIESAAAWDKRLKPFKMASGSRKEYLNPAQVLRLIEAARKENPHFADLLEASYLIGARPPGELAALRVKDFDAKQGTLHIAGIEEGGRKTGERTVQLTSEARGLFTRLAQGKSPADILLPKADGTTWGKSDQHRPMKAARKAAKLSPRVSTYTMRHSHISEALKNGMQIAFVAKQCGTSVKIIESNYAKFLPEIYADAVENMGPRLRLIEGGKNAAA